MPALVSQRVQKFRNDMCAAGLRTMEMWVPDTWRIGFADECCRQSALAAASNLDDLKFEMFLENVAARTEGWE